MVTAVGLATMVEATVAGGIFLATTMVEAAVVGIVLATTTVVGVVVVKVDLNVTAVAVEVTFEYFFIKFRNHLLRSSVLVVVVATVVADVVGFNIFFFSEKINDKYVCRLFIFIDYYLPGRFPIVEDRRIEENSKTTHNPRRLFLKRPR